MLFRQAAKVVPDLDYPTSSVLEISDSRALKRILREPKATLLFIISPRWQRSPLVTRSIEKHDRQVHFIVQKEGGPTIDLFWHSPREVDGVLAVPHGFISYHDCFWNPMSGCMEPVAEELIKTYREIRSHLVRGGKKIIRAHRQLIATKNVLALGPRLIDLKNNRRDKTRLVPVSEGVAVSKA